VVVSGSGPTVALLTRSAAESVRVASALAGLGVCRTVRRATGPVAGARVVTGDGAPA
jgi:4-diphosphocytidyl-2-C-methyl-D-erythritol kinase